MKKILLTCSAMAVLFSLHAQSSRTFIIPKAASTDVGKIREDWNPVIQNMEMPSPIPGSEQAKIQAIKDSLTSVYSSRQNVGTEKMLAVVAPPFLSRNFQGNAYNSSVPNDNELAVSNAGKIVSVQNSTVFKYDLSTSTVVGIQSLSAFASVLANPNVKYDPKVIYDPGADKFICVFLNGYTDSTSTITVAFSQTGDPNGVWNFYLIPGNPLNNQLWSDYPMLAVSDRELFVTVNLLRNNMPWQTGWVETVVWQMNKQKGYTGQTLNPVLRSGIRLGGKGIRNLCPVKGGSYVYGPGMYFLSERNLAPANDSVFIVRVTDTIGAPAVTVTTAIYHADKRYFMPPNAKQPGPSSTQNIMTNDSRILGAFIENNLIQYVSNTMDTTTGRCGIYHGIISNVTTSPVINGRILGDTILHIGYPNISYSGGGALDNASVISFEHSALTVFPGTSAIAYDGNGSYSARRNVKSGLNYMNIIAGGQRWGDYSGSQRKFDQPGVVWVNGLYATAGRVNSTWIAELSYFPAGIEAHGNATNMSDLKLFPNPLNDLVNVSFRLETNEYLYFEIYDLEGKLVKILLKDKVMAGSNNFSFSASALPAGEYILKIGCGEKNVLTKKFVKN